MVRHLNNRQELDKLLKFNFLDYHSVSNVKKNLC